MRLWLAVEESLTVRAILHTVNIMSITNTKVYQVWINGVWTAKTVSRIDHVLQEHVGEAFQGNSALIR